MGGVGEGVRGWGGGLQSSNIQFFGHLTDSSGWHWCEGICPIGGLDLGGKQGEICLLIPSSGMIPGGIVGWEGVGGYCSTPSVLVF